MKNKKIYFLKIRGFQIKNWRNPSKKTAKSKLKSGEPKHRIVEIQTLKKNCFFVWISQILSKIWEN
jgi:hypothetical protein